MNGSVLFTKLILAVLGIFGSLSNARTDATDLPYTEMRAASLRYLRTCATPSVLAGLQKKLINQVETLMSDCGDSEEEATCKTLFAWAFSNQSKIEMREHEAMVQFCYYFIVFREKHFAIPKLLTDRLSPEKMRAVISWLNSETEKNGKSLASK